MTTTTFFHLPAESDRRNIALGSIDWLVRAIKAPDSWRQRQKSRAQFSAIDVRILRDSGICEAQHFIEVNKPFWEA